MRDSMVIYRSFFEAIKMLEIDEQADVWSAVCDYGLNFVEPKLTGVSATVFMLIKPQLDANIKRYENGMKPKLKQKATNVVANDNVNVNVSDNIKDTRVDVSDVVSKPKKSKPKAAQAAQAAQPSLDDIIKFFKDNGYRDDVAVNFYHYYNDAGWHDSTGKPILSWKSKARVIWFKPENRIQQQGGQTYQRNQTYRPA